MPPVKFYSSTFSSQTMWECAVSDELIGRRHDRYVEFSRSLLNDCLKNLPSVSSASSNSSSSPSSYVCPNVFRIVRTFSFSIFPDLLESNMENARRNTLNWINFNEAQKTLRNSLWTCSSSISLGLFFKAVKKKNRILLSKLPKLLYTLGF